MYLHVGHLQIAKPATAIWLFPFYKTIPGSSSWKSVIKLPREDPAING